jgi:hypothetical protein
MAKVLNNTNIFNNTYYTYEHEIARRIDTDEYLQYYNKLNHKDNAYTFNCGGLILWYFENKLIRTKRERDELPENGNYKIVFIHLNNLDIRKYKNKLFIDINQYQNYKN